MDKDLCKKHCCGVKGLKNSPKMLQNPLNKFKSQFFPKILKIHQKKTAYFALCEPSVCPSGWSRGSSGAEDYHVRLGDGSASDHLWVLGWEIRHVRPFWFALTPRPHLLNSPLKRKNRAALKRKKRKNLIFDFSMIFTIFECFNAYFELFEFF